MDPDRQSGNSTTVTSIAGECSDGRKICSNCDRPVKVCLCSIIPSEPISTVTRIVILHHPHEQRHKLATVPVLSKCLRNCDVIVGRRLHYGDSDVLDFLHDDAMRNPNFNSRAIYLFPGADPSPSQEISHWKSSKNIVETSNYVLIAFDGTWKHAREMMHASLSFLSKFAVQVHLDYDVGNDGGTIYNSDLILRKEPFSGCMSTMEAVAHCLRILEPNGIDRESSLIEVLRSMVKFQASFLKPMKPRPKLIKGGREGKI
ncbi:tRNA-uridine aminocarboxypropyltransferase 2 [Capsicum galapagoense]